MMTPIDLVFIMGLIFGLVEFVKSLGVQGNLLRFVSFLIGALLFAAFQLRAMYPEAQPWIDLALYTVGGGLSACGYYSFIDKRLPTLNAK